MRVSLEHLDVLSVAKMMAAIQAVLGLIVGVIYGLFWGMAYGAMGLAGRGGGPGEMMASGAMAAICPIVVLPIVSAIAGFVSGAISAWVYNLAASQTGGVTMDFSLVEGLMGQEPPYQELDRA